MPFISYAEQKVSVLGNSDHMFGFCFQTPPASSAASLSFQLLHPLEQEMFQYYVDRIHKFSSGAVPRFTQDDSKQMLVLAASHGCSGRILCPGGEIQSWVTFLISSSPFMRTQFPLYRTGVSSLFLLPLELWVCVYKLFF